MKTSNKINLAGSKNKTIFVLSFTFKHQTIMNTKNFNNSPKLHELALSLFKDNKDYFIFNDKLNTLLTKHGFIHQQKGGFLNALRNYALQQGITIPKEAKVMVTKKKQKLNKQKVDYLAPSRVDIRNDIYNDVYRLGVDKSITLCSTNPVNVLNQHKKHGLNILNMFEKDSETYNKALLQLEQYFGKRSVECQLLVKANIMEYIKTGRCNKNVYVEFDSCGAVTSAKDFLTAKVKPQFWSLTTTKWVRGVNSLTSEQAFDLFCKYVGGKNYQIQYNKPKKVQKNGAIIMEFKINGVKYRSIEYKISKHNKPMRIFLNF